MPTGTTTAPAAPVTSSDRYHPLVVKRVVTESDDAVSLVFDVPTELSDAYAYTSGQFVTLRVTIDGEAHLRSYSMSSAPATDSDLQVTIKRVPDGLVSNWINESVRPGDEIDVSTPMGVFVLADANSDVLAFAGGSGITPIYSIVKTALHTTDRAVRVLYANRDRAATIFYDGLTALCDQFAGRLFVHFHEDAHNGFMSPGDVRAFADGYEHADVYICGPGPFMDVVESGLQDHDDDRVYIERFTPATEVEAADEPDAADSIEVTITLRGKTETVAHRAKNTLLQTARWAGMQAPSSCEAGHCATCMAQVIEGTVDMKHNEVLTPEEVAEGWVLTCQTVPTSPVVKVVYE